ncbi:uncharacterized protein [Diadema setosum]|uniref:uncharacterized protein n=1 Tax=Diadema setosum TaxID=31175 RepID=UPI003B3AA84E
MMQKVSRFETNQGLEIGELISKYSKAQESGTRREPQPVPSNYESDALTKLWPTPGPRQEDTSAVASQPEHGMEGHYQQPSTSSPNNMMIPAASTSTPGNNLALITENMMSNAILVRCVKYSSGQIAQDNRRCVLVA